MTARLVSGTVAPFAPPSALLAARAHLDVLAGALESLDVARLHAWGSMLAAVLTKGGRLLALGNGGSAAQAQHLTAELVGRYRDDRPPYSAIALCSEAPALTAIGNDYGTEWIFARQVAAHGRPGDVLLALSTSGASRNVLAAASAAGASGMAVLALTGALPNPLAAVADDAVAVGVPSTSTVQEVHLVAIHLLCTAFDASLAS